MSCHCSPGRRSIKVIETGNIQQIVYGFLFVLYRNFVPKTTFFEIFTLKPGLEVAEGHLK